MDKQEEFLIQSDLDEQMYPKPSKTPPSGTTKQQSIIVLSQKEHLLAHLHQKFKTKKGNRSSIDESELMGQINDDEEKEII